MISPTCVVPGDTGIMSATSNKILCTIAWHAIIKGHPCLVTEVGKPKKGKNGVGKVRLAGADLFTGKRISDMQAVSNLVVCPFGMVERLGGHANLNSLLEMPAKLKEEGSVDILEDVLTVLRDVAKAAYDPWCKSTNWSSSSGTSSSAGGLAKSGDIGVGDRAG